MYLFSQLYNNNNNNNNNTKKTTTAIVNDNNLMTCIHFVNVKRPLTPVYNVHWSIMTCYASVFQHKNYGFLRIKHQKIQNDKSLITIKLIRNFETISLILHFVILLDTLTISHCHTEPLIEKNRRSVCYEPSIVPLFCI